MKKDNLNIKTRFFGDVGSGESESFSLDLNIQPPEPGLKQLVTDGENMWLEDAELNHKWAKGEGERVCFHDRCTDCNGTGSKKNGELCVHFISCPCPKCSPTY